VTAVAESPLVEQDNVTAVGRSPLPPPQKHAWVAHPARRRTGIEARFSLVGEEVGLVLGISTTLNQADFSEQVKRFLWKGEE